MTSAPPMTNMSLLPADSRARAIASGRRLAPPGSPGSQDRCRAGAGQVRLSEAHVGRRVRSRTCRCRMPPPDLSSPSPTVTASVQGRSGLVDVAPLVVTEVGRCAPLPAPPDPCDHGGVVRDAPVAVFEVLEI